MGRLVEPPQTALLFTAAKHSSSCSTVWFRRYRVEGLKESTNAARARTKHNTTVCKQYFLLHHGCDGRLNQSIKEEERERERERGREGERRYCRQRRQKMTTDEKSILDNSLINTQV